MCISDGGSFPLEPHAPSKACHGSPHLECLQTKDRAPRLGRMESIHSARNSLIELGVNPLVSLVPHLLDAAGEEEQERLPAAAAAIPAHQAQPSGRQRDSDDVRSHVI